MPPRALERMAVRLARTRSMTSALSRSWGERVGGGGGAGRQARDPSADGRRMGDGDLMRTGRARTFHSSGLRCLTPLRCCAGGSLIARARAPLDQPGDARRHRDCEATR